MFKLFIAPLITTVVFISSIPSSYALSCIQEDLTTRFRAADTVAIIQPTELMQQKATDPHNASFFWGITVQTVFKGEIDDSAVIKDEVWPGGTETLSRLEVNKTYLVFLNEENTMGICNYPRSIDDQPLTPSELATLNDTNEPSISCKDYQCRDGSRFPSCTAEGVQIAYLVAPCSTHGGDVGEFTPTQPVVFIDVPANHPHALAIEWAQASGLVQGYNDGTFKPDNTINRAEFLKILLEPVSAVCRAYYPYTDVNFSAWYGDYVQAASCQALVRGYSDGTFRPAAKINVAEAAKIIVKHHSQGAVEQATTPDWYTPFVSYLQLRNSFPSTIVFANDELTRSEMVAMMYALNVYDKSQLTTDDSDLNPDNEEDCLVAGGDWSIHGLLPQPSCSLPTKDAGQLCSDSSECQANCYYPYNESNAEIEDEVVGQCQETTSPFGCFAFVEDGKLEPTLCID